MSILDLLFPRRCVGCGREGSWVCHLCGEGLATPGWPRSVGQRVVAGFSFKERVVREALHHLKYHSVHEMAELLVAKLPVEELGITNETVLVPVPTSFARLKKRGYNQAELIARAIAKRVNCQVDSTVLVKRARGTQVGRTRKERLERARTAFELKGPVPSGAVLVDDLYTTGATIAGCREAMGGEGPAIVLAYDELGD